MRTEVLSEVRIRDMLLSPSYWGLRAVSLIPLILIWSGIKMSSIIVTPVEFMPVLVLIGLGLTTFFTFLRSKKAFNDTVKAKLRAGTITEVPEYGLDYMSSHVANIVIGVAGAFIIPGWLYEILGATPDYIGCIAVALVWSVIVGIKGAETMTEVVDLFRDKAKISDLTPKKE